MGNAVQRKRVWRMFFAPLIAVVAGNLIYFFLLMPHLPERARHGIGKLDLGLIVDFWVCVVVYGVLELLTGSRRRRG